MSRQDTAPSLPHPCVCAEHRNNYTLILLLWNVSSFFRSADTGPESHCEGHQHHPLRLPPRHDPHLRQLPPLQRPGLRCCMHRCEPSSILMHSHRVRTLKWRSAWKRPIARAWSSGSNLASNRIFVVVCVLSLRSGVSG